MNPSGEQRDSRYKIRCTGCNHGREGEGKVTPELQLAGQSRKAQWLSCNRANHGESLGQGSWQGLPSPYNREELIWNSQRSKTQPCGKDCLSNKSTCSVFIAGKETAIIQPSMTKHFTSALSKTKLHSSHPKSLLESHKMVFAGSVHTGIRHSTPGKFWTLQLKEDTAQRFPKAAPEN